MEKTIKEHINNGLSMSEAIEYEAHKTRMCQLTEKMSTMSKN